jgi:hypothetical protein
VHLTGMVATGLLTLLARTTAPGGLLALQDALFSRRKNIVWDGVL